MNDALAGVAAGDLPDADRVRTDPDQEKLHREMTRKSLRYSVYDGVFSSLMVGFTQDYFTPYVLLIGASARAIGILSALPNLVSSVAQLKTADLAEKIGARRPVIVLFIFLQSLVLLTFSALIFLHQMQVGIAIALVTLYITFGAFANPVWSSLMADLVPREKRGEYFGWRGKVFGLITIGATLVAGAAIHFSKKWDVALGFGILFFMAFVFRAFSTYYLRKMWEPPQFTTTDKSFSFFHFILHYKKSNFVRFALFVSLLYFAVSLAGPFFAVFLLQDLGVNYLTYTVITSAPALAYFLTIRRWGVTADRVGNMRIIRWTAGIMGFIPIFWLFNHHPLYLLAVQLLGGFAWAGFGLCASNFIFDACSPGKRTRCIGYFNMVSGICACLGALTAGFLAKYVPEILGYKLHFLFLLSGLLRLAIIYLIPFHLKEVRPVESMKSTDIFFSIVRLKPFLGIDRKSYRL